MVTRKLLCSEANIHNSLIVIMRSLLALKCVLNDDDVNEVIKYVQFSVHK